MCAVGDIILVMDYINEGIRIGKHSFVVINDREGQIQGLDYDLICNVMSSFKDEEHRKKKLSHPENFPVTYDDVNVPDRNQKDGFLKADQLFYFNKSKTKFIVIGSMKEDTLKLLIQLIESLDSIKIITENL